MSAKPRHRAAALAPLLLAACTAGPAPPPAASPPQPDAPLAERAAILGGFLRAALLCGQPVSTTAQDRAAAIEAAALNLRQRQGGTAARDAFLRALQPPAFDPRRQGRDRDAWCARQRPDIRRVAAWLDSEEGAAFAAEAARR
jgi:hypothetical protein